MINKLVIFGNTNQAEMANYYFEHDSNFDVIGFTVDDDFVGNGKFCGKEVIPFSIIQKTFPPNQYRCFVAVGYTDQNRMRENIYLRCKEKGYVLASYISSKATTFDTLEVGDNCFILEDNTIQPFAKIENDVCLWSGNHIGHHVLVRSHSFITSHVVISGGVTIGNNVFIGVNSTIRDHIEIADYSLIGANSWINKNTEVHGIYRNMGTKLYKIGE